MGPAGKEMCQLTDSKTNYTTTLQCSSSGGGNITLALYRS